MTGPRMGRTFGVMAAACAVVVAVRSVPHAETSGLHGFAVAGALLAGAAWAVRLLLWSLVWTVPREVVPDRRVRLIAEAALRSTEVAVVCDGESLVLVRTATIAAIAATGSPTRVLLVGADPRLDEVARSLGVRRVASGVGARDGIARAVTSSAGEYLVITSASTAVLPGTIRPALESFDEQVAWVQSEPVAPGDRSLADHVRHERWWPSLDARRAMPWLGFGSIVRVEVFAALPVARGASAATVAAQSQAWSGRWHQAMLTVEQVDAGGSATHDVEARAERLRTMRGRRSPLWARGLRPAQRLAHVALFVEDLVGLAAAVALGALVSALFTGLDPLVSSPSSTTWLLALAIGCSWASRALLTGGLVRPGGLCRAATDDLSCALRSIWSSVRPFRDPVPMSRSAPVSASRGWRSQAGVIAVVVVLDVALGWRAWRLLVADAWRSSSLDAALLTSGVVAVASLLASARVLRRRRTLRSGRRLAVDVAARIGTHQGRVLDLAAGGLRVEFAAPAELLAEFPVRLMARGLDPVDVRAQVVRVDQRDETWVVGMRLAGGGVAGEHDDYLALWLWQMAGAAEEPPRREVDPVVGRLPWRSGGVPAVRLATAMVMVAVGIAVFPSGAATAGTTTAAAPTTGPATATSEASSPDSSAADGIGGAETTGSTGAPADTIGSDRDVVPGPIDTSDATPAPDVPTAVEGDLRLSSSVDDDDRLVEGGQVITHTATITNTATVDATSVVLTARPDLGIVDATSFGGTCPGASTGTTGIDGRGTVGWSLLGDAGTLAPGSMCSVTWRTSLPAATDLDDGTVVTTGISISDYTMVGQASAVVGPSVVDEVVVRRATLRLSVTAADGSDVGDMTFGQPFTWLLTVENISTAAVTAHGIDLVDTLPKHWQYTSTVSVTPSSCDVAPVVLVDDANARQVVTWSDTCDLEQGEALVIAFTATPGVGAIDDPEMLDETGAPAVHRSEVTLTAEDIAGNTLGSAADRAGARTRTVDLVARLTDIGPDDAAALESAAVTVGLTGRYRIDVANEGPDPTTTPVTASLDLPPGIAATAAGGDGWTCIIGIDVECTAAAGVAAGAVAPPIVVALAIGAEALVDDGSDGDPDVAIATATVTAGGGGIDGDPSNDVDDESTLVRRAGDIVVAAAPTRAAGAVLSVVAITGARTVDVGDDITYEVVVSNQGPVAEDQQVEVRADVPPGFEVAAAVGEGWSCDVEAASDVARAAWRCTWDAVAAPVAAGALLPPIVVAATVTSAAVPNLAPSARVPVVQEIRARAISAVTIEKTARVSWIAEPATTNTISIVDASATTWQMGVAHSVDVVVGNDGPNGEYGPVTVQMPVTPAFDIEAVEGGGWSCATRTVAAASGSDAEPQRIVECTRSRRGVDYGEALIVAGEVLPPLEVVMTPRVDGAATQTISVVGVTDARTRSSTAEVEVARSVGLSLTADAPSPARRGRTTTVQWTVANTGPSRSSSPVVVTGAVPVGFELVDAVGPAWACEQAQLTLRCRSDRSVGADGSTAVTVTLMVGAEVPLGGASVAATLVADPSDRSIDDDADVVDIRVLERADGDTDDPGDTDDTSGAAGTADTGAAQSAPAADEGSTERRPIRSSDLAGFGGSAGAFAFAVVLVTGRRRRGW